MSRLTDLLAQVKKQNTQLGADLEREFHQAVKSSRQVLERAGQCIEKGRE